ncbi:hypothetical protein FOZ60_003009 [Perkinsus olseni]|uniref:Uncharacterized protein n=1 Tax=Perkinsus olseni TaxID=32597 RepID=A0A7J6NWL0_PEROL|nr:hypothetical protein FOZ60_003009 [Perkinsus olseni]
MMLPNDLIDGQQIFVNLDGDLMVEHFNTSELLLDDITMFKVSRLVVGAKVYFQLTHFDVGAMLPADSEESLADSDSEESYDDVEYVKRIPDEVSEERTYIKGEWVMEGSFLMGCILDDTFYYVINGDETHMRKKDLRAPESDPVVAMDLPGRLSDMKLADGTLCAVTWSKKVYALERDGRGMYATMDELENAREDAENGVRVVEPTTRYNSAIAVLQLVHTTRTY